MSPLLDQLVKAFCCLPGVGPRSAQRMAMNLLENGRENGLDLAAILDKSMREIKNCESCRTFTEERICKICQDPIRDKSILCVVESPSDVLAIEQSGSFKGEYFVLMGHLSPIDGVGPEDLGIDHLIEKIAEKKINEIIIATNSTVEGEATAYYIMEASKEYGLTISRIAHGVPMGGELEFVDSHTLSHAFNGRKILETS